MDKRRIPVMITIVMFMIVTIAHVTIYAGRFEPNGSVVLGLLYAVAVEASIAVCAFFTAWKTTARWAWVGFFAFTLASGVMNWGYIEPDTLPAVVYALFPTGAIALMGFLYRQVDVLTKHKTVRANVGRTQSEPTPVRPEPLPEQKANYKDEIWQLLDDYHHRGEKPPEQAKIVEMVGASKATVSKWVNQYPNGSVK